MDVRPLRVLRVVKKRSLRRADHSSRGFLPSVVCLSVISKPQQLGGLEQLGLSSHEKMLLLCKLHSEIRENHSRNQGHSFTRV